MKLENCTKCKLCKTRTQVVIHRGIKSDIMLVGEAPGKNEDEQGKPFVGRAGKVLDNALGKAELLDKVYITNIVKCRPPDNRDPTDIEKDECSYWLKKQIKLLNPKLIVCLGNHAFSGMNIIADGSLVKINIGFTKEHYYLWHTFTYGAIKVYKVLHPAATLYNPNLKDTFYKQIKNIKELV